MPPTDLELHKELTSSPYLRRLTAAVSESADLQRLVDEAKDLPHDALTGLAYALWCMKKDMKGGIKRENHR